MDALMTHMHGWTTSDTVRTAFVPLLRWRGCSSTRRDQSISSATSHIDTVAASLCTYFSELLVHLRIACIAAGPRMSYCITEAGASLALARRRVVTSRVHDGAPHVHAGELWALGTSVACSARPVGSAPRVVMVAVPKDEQVVASAAAHVAIIMPPRHTARCPGDVSCTAGRCHQRHGLRGLPCGAHCLQHRSARMGSIRAAGTP